MIQCCFIRSCTVSEGSGLCKNDTRDACDGDFYTGDLVRFLSPPTIHLRSIFEALILFFIGM